MDLMSKVRGFFNRSLSLVATLSPAQPAPVLELTAEGPISDRQIELVQSTWQRVLPISDQAAELFYGRLFDLDPDLKALFVQTDMQEQHKKLMQMITVVVAGIDRLDDIVPAVQELGKRHLGYGVKDEHYDTVGAALLWTLEQGLGGDFTPEVGEAWAITYTVLADTMRGVGGEAVVSSGG